MTGVGPVERARENVAGIVSVLVTGIWMAALFTDQGWWLGFMLVGYVVLVPLVALLAGDEADRAKWWHGDERDEPASRSEDASTAETDDALATLRERYARGELTDEQFERKVERLLETDTLENVEDRHRAPAVDADSGSGSGDPDGDAIREPD